MFNHSQTTSARQARKKELAGRLRSSLAKSEVF